MYSDVRIREDLFLGGKFPLVGAFIGIVKGVPRNVRQFLSFKADYGVQCLLLFDNFPNKLLERDLSFIRLGIHCKHEVFNI